ncbi:MAG: NapC/NirT family cytochrome c [Candidatus Accumulibacter sp.]|jgi:cytochrome c-type protein NapC|nr:NapC/NirT family cytochrome c [Accumulibacter sp.]
MKLSTLLKTLLKTLLNLLLRWRKFVLTGVVAFAAGALGVVVFDTAMEQTNTEAFCISCHEMKNTVYSEYQGSLHYTNRSGMRATCPDCHVPKEFAPKMVAKIKASNDLLHNILGTIDTPAKFEARRPKMAQSEWRRMKANDSQECRNCHDADSFDYGVQSYRSVNQHTEGLASGQTCIDCHKGITHRLPQIDQGVGSLVETGLSQDLVRPPVTPKE